MQDFRLVLVDDASEDDSVQIARAVAGDRIEIVQNETAIGIGANWNRCAELVDTPFFCLAHQDDTYKPDFLLRMLDVLEADKKAGIVHCRAQAICADGLAMKSAAERYKEHFWQVTDSQDLATHYARLWSGNYVCCPSVIYRTEAFKQCGLFAPHLRFALDWDYWFRMLREGFGIACVDDELIQYRRHDDAATYTASLGHWRFAEELEVLHQARDAGIAAGLLPADSVTSPALRNILLHEALTDLQRGNRQAMQHKLAFVREHGAELWNDPYVRVFRTLTRFGPPGRWLLQMGRGLALRYGLGGGAG